MKTIAKLIYIISTFPFSTFPVSKKSHMALYTDSDDLPSKLIGVY